MDCQIDFLIDLQTEIIKTQEEIIHALFHLLSRYMTTKQMEKIPTVKKMREVDEMIERLRGGTNGEDRTRKPI
jgi:hypothetical protein